MKKINVQTLLLGGSGNLGSSLIKSRLFTNLKFPRKKTLNILSKRKIENYLLKNNIKIVIHCAGMARVRECERFKNRAFKTNILGTTNIVKSIKKIDKKHGLKIKLVYISSDAVYPSIRGNYRENDKLKHYNYYGYTKIKGEKIVKKLKDYIIIRTRFFNKKKIKFKFSAVNLYNSGLEVSQVATYIYKLLKKNFKGIINVGGKRVSDFTKYKKFKPSLKPCDKSKILDNLNFKIAIDASMNISKLKKIL